MRRIQRLLAAVPRLLVLALTVAACSDASGASGVGATLETSGAGSGSGSGSGSGTGTGPEPASRFQALADAVLADLEASVATAASVAVWIDGEVVWVGGFGTLDPDGRTPGPDTVFMIGSDTKKLTALSLLRRVDAGAATLDTSVAEVLPELEMAFAADFPPGATVRHLLSHQGGLVDDAEVTATTSDEAFEGYLLGEFAQTYYAMAPPGRFWNYSNPNFSVAGFLDQRLDGRMWPDIVQEDLFAPLGMDRTVARKSEVDADHAPGVGLSSASLDDTSIGPVPLEELWDSAFSRPSGLVWSTPADQMRLAAFLVDGDPSVLGSELLGELVSPQAPLYPDLPGAYGFGLFVQRGLALGDDWYDLPVWSHGGDTVTHTSTFYVLPDQRFAISILSNGTYDDFTRSVEAAMRSLVSLPPPAVAPEPPFDPSALDALTGTYVDEFSIGEVIVTRAGDLLEIEAPALDAYAIPYEKKLSPLSTRVWIAVIDGTEVDLSFIDGPDGEAYLGNRGFVAIRPAAAVSAVAPPSPARQAVVRALDAARRDPVPALLRPRPPRSPR